MPTASEARQLAEECERLVVTATNPENRALLLKIAQLWRDVASCEQAVESGQAIAMRERPPAVSETAGASVLANTQAEALLLKTRARHWRRKAAELRVAANGSRNHVVGETLGRLAQDYDDLADQADVTASSLDRAQAG